MSVVTLLLAGCGRVERATPAPTAVAVTLPAPADRAQVGGPATTSTTEAIPVAELEVFTVLDLVATDLDAFWIDELDKPFAALGPARPLRPSSSEPVECGGVVVPVDQIKDNAFFCRPDRTVSIDTEGLAPRLDDVVGGLAVALLVAHEWGHAVQQTRGVRPEGVGIELQADCLAGVWAAELRAGRRPGLVANDDDVNQALAGFVVVRDNDVVGGGAHGTALDRVAAFQDGLNGGAARCFEYDTAPPTLVRLPVTPEDEAGAEVPLAIQLGTAPAVQDIFWLKVLGRDADVDRLMGPAGPGPATGSGCGAGELSARVKKAGIWLCPNDRTVWWDSEVLARTSADLGDFAVQLRVTQLWAALVRIELGWTGAPVVVAPGDGGLPADCLVGVWAQDAARPLPEAVPGERPVLRDQMTGNDLDELVAGILVTDDGGNGDSGPTALERLAAFRSGFVDGLPSCL